VSVGVVALEAVVSLQILIKHMHIATNRWGAGCKCTTWILHRCSPLASEFCSQNKKNSMALACEWTISTERHIYIYIYIFIQVQTFASYWREHIGWGF
jgi:hypothetical protein